MIERTTERYIYRNNDRTLERTIDRNNDRQKERYIEITIDKDRRMDGWTDKPIKQTVDVGKQDDT